MSFNISLSHSRSLEVVENVTIRKLACGFLFVSYSNYGLIVYDFRDNGRYWPRIAIIFILLHSTTPCKYCHNVSYGESRKTKERTVLSEFTSEVRDTTCQWDHTVLSATDRGDRPAYTLTGQVGTRFIDPVRMKDWVGLVGWLHISEWQSLILSPWMITCTECLATVLSQYLR